MSHSNPLNSDTIANLLGVCTGGRVYAPSEDSSDYMIDLPDCNVARACCEQLSYCAQNAGLDVMTVRYDGDISPKTVSVSPLAFADNFFIYEMLKEKLQQHYHTTVEMRIDSVKDREMEDEVTLYIHLSSMSEVNAVTKDFEDSSNTVGGVSVVSDTADLHYTLGVSANALAKQPQLLAQVLANPPQVDVNGYIRSRYIMPTFEIGDSKPTSEAADNFLRSLTSGNDDNGMIIMPDMNSANQHVNRLRNILDSKLFAVDYNEKFDVITIKYLQAMGGYKHTYKLKQILSAVAEEQDITDAVELIQNNGLWVIIDPKKLDAHPDYMEQLELNRNAINAVHTLQGVQSASDLLRLARNITPGLPARGRQF